MHQITFKRLVLIFILQIFIGTNYGFAHHGQLKPVDSLMRELSRARTDFKKIELWGALSKLYIDAQDLKNAKLYADLTLAKATKNNKLFAYGTYYNAIGDIEYAKQKFVKAQRLYLKASDCFYNCLDYKNFVITRISYSTAFSPLYKYDYTIKNLLKTFKIAQQKIPNEYKIMSDLLRILANAQNYMDQNDAALKNLLNSIKLSKKANDHLGTAKNYLEIGTIFLHFGNVAKALEYNEKALAIYNQYHLNHKQLFLLINFNIADLSRQLGEYSKSTAISFQNLNAIEQNDLFGYHFYFYFNLASVYYEQKKFKKAIAYAELASESLINDPVNSIMVDILKAKIYFASKNHSKSKTFYDKVILLTESKEFKELFKAESSEFYQEASENEFILKNYRQAYLLNLKYREKEINLLRREKDKKIQDLLAKFEFKDKTIEIALDKKIIQNQQYHIKITLLISVLITLCIVVITFSFVKLQAKNREIAHKNNELEESQDLLVNSLQQKEILLKEIHHRVKNNLQIIMSFLNIQAKEGKPKSVDEFLEISESRIQSMALIHQCLYECESINSISFQNYVSQLTDYLKSVMGLNSDRIAIEIDVENISLDIETAMPLSLIINELLTNSFKYAFPSQQSGEVQIKMRKLPDFTYELIYSDNGIGFDSELKTKQSFGVELVKMLVKQLKGNLTKEPFEGTKYNIAFKQICSGKSAL
ncbi:MAG: hypothetical protein CFE24_13465 [Flavobacterium sp. BFFFF2]|nr:MAG: hypothetical protein CFE24_13465 [Flavobacterium sp. BFFFF2]